MDGSDDSLAGALLRIILSNSRNEGLAFATFIDDGFSLSLTVGEPNLFSVSFDATQVRHLVMIRSNLLLLISLKSGQVVTWDLVRREHVRHGFLETGDEWFVHLVTFHAVFFQTSSGFDILRGRHLTDAGSDASVRNAKALHSVFGVAGTHALRTAHYGSWRL